MGVSDQIFLFGTLFPDMVRKFWPYCGRFLLASKRNPRCVYGASLCTVRLWQYPLHWPPAYTGHPPPRRPGFIGAVFSRAACNPRLGRAADCHTMGPRVTSWPRSRVTCHAVPILAPAPHWLFSLAPVLPSESPHTGHCWGTDVPCTVPHSDVTHDKQIPVLTPPQHTTAQPRPSLKPDSDQWKAWRVMTWSVTWNLRSLYNVKELSKWTYDHVCN